MKVEGTYGKSDSDLGNRAEVQFRVQLGVVGFRDRSPFRLRHDVKVHDPKSLVRVSSKNLSNPKGRVECSRIKNIRHEVGKARSG